MESNLHPITEDQEWTLRNWVSTFGARPGPRERAFLLTEKGLTEGQIDSWWNKNQGNTLLLLYWRSFVNQ
jgi:hypothetical protein